MHNLLYSSFFGCFSFIDCFVIQPGLEKPKRGMETHTVVKGSKNAFAGHLRAKVNTTIMLLSNI